MQLFESALKNANNSSNSLMLGPGKQRKRNGKENTRKDEENEIKR